MIKHFRDKWLYSYYFKAQRTPNIPAIIESALRRKLDIVHIAAAERDLRIPPGNRFEYLSGNLRGWCSIRVNKQYRLIFQWESGEATGIYLDPHKYKR